MIFYSNIFQYLACGNRAGQVFIWNVRGRNAMELAEKPAILSHNDSRMTIRQVAFSMDDRILIAVSDDSTVYRWDIK